MPEWDQHVEFVESRPYREWDFIHAGGKVVGSIYLTANDEIGVFVFKAHQGSGYGQEAVRQMMERHGKRRYLANINPRNTASIEMFKGLGFNLIQHTYELT